MTAPDGTTSPTSATLAPDATIDALASGAVVQWWQTTAFVRVAGPDAVTLLDGLCTQAVERIEPGRAVLGLFLDAKARIIAPVVLHRIADATWTDPKRGDEHEHAPVLLLETLPELVEPLQGHLTRYRLRAKASIEQVDVSSIAVIGVGADEVAATIDVEGHWTRLEPHHAPTRTLLASSDACAHVVRELLPAAGVGLADPDTLESVRIDAGHAGLHDLLAGRMPAEVGGMQSAVALDAGCYLGQEPVARLHYRGHANRTLRRVEGADAVRPGGPDGDDPDAAFALRRPTDASDARPAGRLTTWAQRPDGTSTGLAVLRRELAVGDELRLTGSEAALRVVDAPEPT